MKFNSKLIKAKFIKRYNRFFSNHKLPSGEVVIAYCPNTGSMEGLLNKGSKSYLSESKNSNRRLKYTWEIIEINNHLIGINTQNANKIIYENLVNKKIEDFKIYSTINKETKYGKNCKIDFNLKKNKKNTIWIEVKNVTLSRNKNIAEFPDSITKRGKKQLEQMQSLLYKGDSVYVIYLIQRNDVNCFQIADDIDPLYYKNCMLNKGLGMQVLAFTCKVCSESINLDFDNKVKINYE